MQERLIEKGLRYSIKFRQTISKILRPLPLNYSAQMKNTCKIKDLPSNNMTNDALMNDQLTYMKCESNN